MKLAEDLRTLIDQGGSDPQSALPTEFELASRYGLSRQTVRRAFQELVAEGLVERIPGKGTFAVPAARRARYFRSINAVEDLFAMSSDTVMELIKPLAMERNEVAATELGLEDTEVASLRAARYFRDNIFTVADVYLPPKLGDLLLEADALPLRGTRTIIEVLESYWPAPTVGVLHQIDAVPCPADAADMLNERAGDPVLRVGRKYFDADLTFIEWSISYYSPSRYSHRLVLRRNDDTTLPPELR